MPWKIDLDYQRRARRFPWRGGLLLVLALVALGLAGEYYRGLDEQIADWQARVQRLEQAAQPRRAAVPGPGREGRDLAPEIAQANEVLRQLALPWDRLFKAVELSLSEDVALLAMEPDAVKGQVRIGGEAKDVVAMLDYLTRLQGHQEFGGVYLQSHQVRQQEAEKPVRFVLTASWRSER